MSRSPEVSNRSKEKKLTRINKTTCHRRCTFSGLLSPRARKASNRQETTICVAVRSIFVCSQRRRFFLGPVWIVLMHVSISTPSRLQARSRVVHLRPQNSAPRQPAHKRNSRLPDLYCTVLVLYKYTKPSFKLHTQFYCAGRSPWSSFWRKK